MSNTKLLVSDIARKSIYIQACRTNCCLRAGRYSDCLQAGPYSSVSRLAYIVVGFFFIFEKQRTQKYKIVTLRKQTIYWMLQKTGK